MRKGQKHSLEAISKMRLAHLGKSPSNKGIPRSLEARKNMKAAWIVRKQKGLGVAWNKGKKLGPSWNKGIPKSEETKKKLSRSISRFFRDPKNRKRLSDKIKEKWTDPTYRKKCEEAQSGERAVLWRGGIQYEPYDSGFTREFRRKIRERDGFACQVCGKPGKSIHHIDYDKKNSSESNLVTLCFVCHSKTNHNRDTWKTYFQQQRLNEKTPDKRVMR